MFFGKLKDEDSYGFSPFENRFESYVDIDDDEHMALIDKCNSEGKLISADENGYPILVDPPKPTQKECNKQKLFELEDYLRSTDWYVIRYCENNTKIPDDVKQRRQEARIQISELRTKRTV